MRVSPSEREDGRCVRARVCRRATEEGPAPRSCFVRCTGCRCAALCQMPRGPAEPVSRDAPAALEDPSAARGRRSPQHARCAAARLRGRPAAWPRGCVASTSARLFSQLPQPQRCRECRTRPTRGTAHPMCARALVWTAPVCASATSAYAQRRSLPSALAGSRRPPPFRHARSPMRLRGRTPSCRPRQVRGRHSYSRSRSSRSTRGFVSSERRGRQRPRRRVAATLPPPTLLLATRSVAAERAPRARSRVAPRAGLHPAKEADLATLVSVPRRARILCFSPQPASSPRRRSACCVP